MTQTTPFLTEIDSRAEVKGSRDPLGLVAIWSHFGRRVVGNLTTVATSQRDFTLRVLGQWVVERVGELHQDSSPLPTFLRFEQLCSYARFCRDPNASFRGVGGVRSRLDKGRRVTLSAAPEHQLLSNQRTYGVWGMYSVPSANSGLLDHERRLAEDGRSLVEVTCLPFLRAQRIDTDRDLVRLIAEPKRTIDLDGAHRPVIEALGKLLAPSLRANERALYETHLLNGGPQDPTHGRQALLAKIMAKLGQADDEGLSPTLLRAMAKEAKKAGNPQLASDLEAIRICESVLALAARTFGWLAKCPNQTRDWLIAQLRKQLGKAIALDVEAFRTLAAQLRAASIADAERWIRIADAFAAGDYGVVLDELLALNTQVMKQRDGAAWLEFHDGKLSVRFRDEAAELPEAKELPHLWQHSYFVDSLRTLVAQVWEAV